MEPFILRTERFVLDQPGTLDIDDITAFCTDPVFESFMVTPWPYERQHAVYFVDEYVPGGWDRAVEWTWAIREDAGARLLGVVGIRLDSGMVGYWLGAPHRGRGVIPEALAAVIDAVFERTDLDTVRWECVAGNDTSVRVAEKVGFSPIVSGTGTIPARDGSPVDAWTAVLTRPARARV